MKNKDDGSEQLLPKWSISELFLELLDPTTRKFTFQTYTDRKSKRPKGVDPLARVRRGTLDDLASELSELQNQGAGVFVTINATHGKRRRLEDFDRVRAVWVDLDKGLPERPWPLEPSLIVKTVPATTKSTGWCPTKCPSTFYGASWHV